MTIVVNSKLSKVSKLKEKKVRQFLPKNTYCIFCRIFKKYVFNNLDRLPSCVEKRVRDLYPSPNGHYAGFHGLDQFNSLKEF